jgi:hypothetical protein
MPFVSDVNAITVRRHGDDRWALTEPVVYRGSVDTFTVPRGYVTDFASIPPVVVWLIPRYGRWTPAAILHDYLLTDHLADPSEEDNPEHPVSSRDIDGLFRRVMRELGVSTPHRWLMWAGVRWGALVQRKRRAGWWRDAPAVLGLSLLALPLVLPGVLGAVWGRAWLTLVERASPPEPPARGPLLVVERLQDHARKRRAGDWVDRGHDR